MAELSEVTGDIPLGQTSMFWGQLLEHLQNIKFVMAFSVVGVETHAGFSCSTKYRHEFNFYQVVTHAPLQASVICSL